MRKGNAKGKPVLITTEHRGGYWRSTFEARPANGGRGAPVSPSDVQEEKGPLRLCAPGTLHATLLPHKWRGDRLWVVALHGEVIGDAEKFGALKREILGEVDVSGGKT